MNAQIAQADPAPLDRSFAVSWYEEWLDCWNSNRPELGREILTEDFGLDSPTTRHTGLRVQGHQATMEYRGPEGHSSSPDTRSSTSAAIAPVSR